VAVECAVIDPTDAGVPILEYPSDILIANAIYPAACNQFVGCSLFTKDTEQNGLDKSF
jgi:hypothetical protein